MGAWLGTCRLTLDILSAAASPSQATDSTSGRIVVLNSAGLFPGSLGFDQFLDQALDGRSTNVDITYDTLRIDQYCKGYAVNIHLYGQLVFPTIAVKELGPGDISIS